MISDYFTSTYIDFMKLWGRRSEIRRLKEFLAFISTCTLLSSFFVIINPQQASAATTLTTCKSLKSSVQYLAKDSKCNERIYEGSTWYQSENIPTGTPGSRIISINTCQSKSRPDLILVRTKCNNKTQITTTWHRPLGPPAAPSILTITAGVLGSATVATKAPSDNGGARITSYSLAASPTGVEGKTERASSTFNPNSSGEIKISGLTPGAIYTFTLVAHNAVGASASSQASTPFLAPTVPAVPSITAVIATGTNSAVITYTAPVFDGGSPITSYTATAFPGGIKATAYRSTAGTIEVSGLVSSTSYTFSIVANNFAGSSLPSTISAAITTFSPPPPPAPIVEAPAPTPTLAAPAFTLSSSSETRTVSTAATGFTITSTGGTIASFAISATPAGMSFSTSTGALTGTPTSVATATAYTVTATNASGTSTATFTLTVTIIGSTGPGGGVIFYASMTGFSCGPTRVATCKYLEAAPSGWSGAASDPTRDWANSLNQMRVVDNVSSPETATATAIGWGFRNTRAIILQGNSNIDKAAALADAYTVTVGGVVIDDWFLPSRDELYEMCLQRLIVGGFTGNYYWSSSEYSDRFAIRSQGTSSCITGYTNKYTSVVSVRPVRAFSFSAPEFTLSASAETLTVNTAATGFTIISTGSAIASFAISATPAGMSFSTSTGALTGTPTSVATATAYTITATNATGSTTQTFTLTVEAALAAPTFTLSSSSETRIVNTTATGFTIVSTGGTIASFAINTTPAGMSFSASTGALTGTPTSVATATAYTVTATNASGTSTATFTLTVTYADGSTYASGSTGPGGGKIFYYSATGFSCGATYITTGSPTGGLCHYLEVAPSGWNTGADPSKIFAVTAKQGTDVIGITMDSSANNASSGIGLGYLNSIAIVNQGNDTTTAAGAARAYAGGSKSDWYLPTTAELNLLCQWARGVTLDVTTACTGGTSTGAFITGGFAEEAYRSSSTGANAYASWYQHFGTGFQNFIGKNNPSDVSDWPYLVRPVRSF